jgi:transposase
VRGKSRISKRGNRELRKRLYEAILSAALYNPNIQAIYRRLKDQGKPEKVVRTAAARKLLLLAHAIYESGEWPGGPSGYFIAPSAARDAFSR